ncbi:MAG TPA: choice-of-anchor tandem repeat GloVer-containing protein [Candidatus Binatia bacterium]|nr:choice-of-anchor tandem repeat GloVer-containing protein [Candidatus Binatia bacterium]
MFALVLVVAITQPVDAQSFRVLYNFTGGADGRTPSSGVLLAEDGSLYGNTLGGAGSSGHCSGGQGSVCGTVFQLSNTGAGWTLTTLYSFAGGTDGAGPQGMTFAPDGSLYGITVAGGIAENLCSGYFPFLGCGTVYKLTPGSDGTWMKSVLYRFQSQPLDGWYPIGPPVLDSAGNVYGTTAASLNQCGQSGYCGTAYRLTRSGRGWTESAFLQVPGFGPSNLVIDAAGNLYGTTWNGGPLQDNSPAVYNDGVGVAYKLTPPPSGWNATLLHNFNLRLQSCSGESPSGGLIFDRQGNLYGVTVYGGADNAGTAFELSPEGGNWLCQTLYSFQGQDTLGGVGSLVMDSAGNLYGVRDAYSGNYGTVFRLTHTSDGWIYTALHEFNNPDDGEYVPGALTLDGNGSIYGTARLGGAYGYGVIWEITP